MRLNIVEARTAKGWTQGDLAARLGVSQQQIARWEAPDADIKSSTLLRLCSALGVTVSYLMGVDVVDGSVQFKDERGQELLDLYAKMDQPSRDALMLVARGLVCGSQGPRHER